MADHVLRFDIEKAARLWQRILRTDTDRLFGKVYNARLLHRVESDIEIDIAQPGYVGLAYSGLVFLSMNPGNGSSNGLGEEDKRQYKALRQLRNAGPGHVTQVFQELNNILFEITPTWRIYKMLVRPILSPAGWDLSQIAYLTLLQWRTSKSSGLNRLYRICWNAHTREQLDLLKPKIIVVLGKGAWRTLHRYDYPADSRCIPRCIGDRRVSPEGKKAIETVCESLKAMRQ